MNMNVSALSNENHNYTIFIEWIKARTGRRKRMFTALKIAPITLRRKFTEAKNQAISNIDFAILQKHMRIIEEAERKIDEKREIRNQQRRSIVFKWLLDGYGRQMALSRCIGKLPCQINQDFLARSHRSDLTDDEWQNIQYHMKNIEKTENYQAIMSNCLRIWASLRRERFEALKSLYRGKGCLLSTQMSLNGKKKCYALYPQWDLVISHMQQIEHAEKMQQLG